MTADLQVASRFKVPEEKTQDKKSEELLLGTENHQLPTSAIEKDSPN